MLIRWATENDLPAWYALITEVSDIFQHLAISENTLPGMVIDIHQSESAAHESYEEYLCFIKPTQGGRIIDTTRSFG
jgi:hypothetical protein